jgi:hypothetical protein
VVESRGLSLPHRLPGGYLPLLADDSRAPAGSVRISDLFNVRWSGEISAVPPTIMLAYRAIGNLSNLDVQKHHSTLLLP